MDLLRQVLSHQTLDRLLQLPTLVRSSKFIEIRSEIINGVKLKLDFSNYVGFSSFQCELSRMLPAFRGTAVAEEEAFFQRNARAFIQFANISPGIDIWRALKTGIPEIQAKALSLLSQMESNDEEGQVFFYGNSIYPPRRVADIQDIPWTPKLFKVVSRLIQNLREPFPDGELRDLMRGFFGIDGNFNDGESYFLGTAWRHLGFQFKMERDPYLEEVMGKVSVRDHWNILIESGYLYPFLIFTSDDYEDEDDDDENPFADLKCFYTAVENVAYPLLQFFPKHFFYIGRGRWIRRGDLM